MSLDWFEFHPKAFLTDTMRLSTEAKGAYLLLILDYYEKESPAPDDDDVLAAITGLPIETWRRHRKVIEPLFVLENGLWRHPTCDTVITDAKARIARQSAAGKKAAGKRWNRDANGNAPRIRSAVRPASESHTETDTDRNAIAGGNFGPSVTAPSHLGPDNGTVIPNNADRMPIASETQSETHAERYAIEMHTSQFTERREGANAPSRVTGISGELGNEVLLGTQMHPDWTLTSEQVGTAKAEGVTMAELAKWLDDWKARCIDSGMRVINWSDAWDREYHRRMMERAKAKPKARVVTTRKQKLTELPADWQPGARHIEIANERNLDIASCIESFVDFIKNKKPDWSDADAAFRNWLKSPHRSEFKRNGQAPQRRAPAPGGGSIVGAADRLDAEIDRRIAEAEADQSQGRSLVSRVPQD